MPSEEASVVARSVLDSTSGVRLSGANAPAVTLNARVSLSLSSVPRTRPACVSQSSPEGRATWWVTDRPRPCCDLCSDSSLRASSVPALDVLHFTLLTSVTSPSTTGLTRRCP